MVERRNKIIEKKNEHQNEIKCQLNYILKLFALSSMNRNVQDFDKINKYYAIEHSWTIFVAQSQIHKQTLGWPQCSLVNHLVFFFSFLLSKKRKKENTILQMKQN